MGWDKTLLKNPFLRDVMGLAGASGLAQVITLLSAPILTRHYSPEDFGMLGVFLAITTIAVTFSTLRYDLAVVLPKSDQSAWSLVHIAGFWTIICVLFVTTFLFVLHGLDIEYLNNLNSSTYLVWVPLMVLGGGWLALAHHWAIRKKQFGAIGTSSVWGSLAGNGLKIGGGTLGAGGGFLIIASVLQQAFQFSLLSFRLRKDIPAEKADKRVGMELAKEYQSFPKFRMPQDVLASISAQLPHLVLAAYFGPVVVGFYLLAYRMTQAPVSLVREAFRNVYYKKITSLHHQNISLMPSVCRSTILLAALNVPLVLILWFWGESIFSIVFGPEWGFAGVYAKYLAILILASVANTPSVVAIALLDKNRGLLIYEIIGTTLRVSTLIIASQFLSSESTIALYCLVSTLANLGLIAWVIGFGIRDSRLRIPEV